MYGLQEDGGGSHKASGSVGKMAIHRAVNNHSKAGALPPLGRPLCSAPMQAPSIKHLLPVKSKRPLERIAWLQ